MKHWSSSPVSAYSSELLRIEKPGNASDSKSRTWMTLKKSQFRLSVGFIWSRCLFVFERHAVAAVRVASARLTTTLRGPLSSLESRPACTPPFSCRRRPGRRRSKPPDDVPCSKLCSGRLPHFHRWLFRVPTPKIHSNLIFSLFPPFCSNNPNFWMTKHACL